MALLSVLDLSPIPAGHDAGTALRQSRDLASHAEALGYHRYWMAEHHNMPGIASAATAVALAYVAEGTQRIRIGAGGIMLPNHAPLIIAEQFGTLAAIHPGRVDLGIGRAPGTDGLTARAMRRTLESGVDDFPRDVMELIGYFAPPAPGQQIQAVPGAGLGVPVIILGSSLYGAQLAAMLGLPYAFASHFAPADLDDAMTVYRDRFRPSEFLDRPYAMAGFSVFAAETPEEARLLFSSQQQAFVNLRSGRPGPLPPPDPDFESRLDPAWRAALARSYECSAVGTPDRVAEALAAFVARTGVDEIIVAGQIFDHEARKRSLALTARAWDQRPLAA